MKLLILSDSHGYTDHMLRAVELERPDYVLHLGDGSRDTEVLRQQYPMLAVAQVRGNCDYGEFDLPEQRLAEYGGIRILFCHGHRYGVKSGLLRLTYAARESQADVALFGHTHQAWCGEHAGVRLMNPGTCGYTAKPTCGVIEIGDTVSYTVKAIEERMEFP